MLKFYFELFDKKIKNWAFLVLIVSFLVVSVWFIFSPKSDFTDFKSASASVFNIKTDLSVSNDYIIVNWKKYKLVKD